MARRDPEALLAEERQLREVQTRELVGMRRTVVHRDTLVAKLRQEVDDGDRLIRWLLRDQPTLNEFTLTVRPGSDFDLSMMHRLVTAMGANVDDEARRARQQATIDSADALLEEIDREISDAIGGDE